MIRGLFTKVTLLLFSISLGFSLNAAGSSFFVSYDKNGNPIYSDKQPESKKYHEEKARQVITTSWNKTPTVTPLSPTWRSSSSTPTIHKANCQKIAHKISKINADLKIRQTASTFNSLKKQLSELRWSKHTKC